MGAPSSRNLLHFTYSKTVLEIQVASGKKIDALEAKITEREAHIVRLRTEFDISDQDMISLLSQAAQDAELSSLAHHGHGHGVVHEEHADEEGDDAQDEQIELEQEEHLLHLGVPRLRPLDGDLGRQLPAELRCDPVRVRLLVQQEIHPIQPPELAEVKLLLWRCFLCPCRFGVVFINEDS